MRFFPGAWEPRANKNVSYESATLRTQVFGYRLCASRFAANLVLPAHAVPSIRELYHRKWDITLLAALGPGFLVLGKETLHGPSPGRGMDDLQSREPVQSIHSLQLWAL